MARILQLQWSDEPDQWHDVRKVDDHEMHHQVIEAAEQQRELFRQKYPHHTFKAEFRVVNVPVFQITGD